jgi:hypothetical protein
VKGRGSKAVIPGGARSMRALGMAAGVGLLVVLSSARVAARA